MRREPPTRATLVFRGPRGGELSRSDVSRDLHKHALEDAALRRTLRLHDLRHTAAASWLAAGLPLIYVQRQLGHASITTTQQVYGHLEESLPARRRGARRAADLDAPGRIGRPRTPPVWSHGWSHARSDPHADAAENEESPAICGAFHMRRRGLEPPRAISAHKALNLARLPIPPPAQVGRDGCRAGRSIARG